MLLKEIFCKFKMKAETTFKKCIDFLDIVIQLVGSENTVVIAQNLPPWLKHKDYWANFVSKCKQKEITMSTNHDVDAKATLHILPGDSLLFKNEGMTSFLYIPQSTVSNVNSHVIVMCVCVLLLIVFLKKLINA